MTKVNIYGMDGTVTEKIDLPKSLKPHIVLTLSKNHLKLFIQINDIPMGQIP